MKGKATSQILSPKSKKVSIGWLVASHHFRNQICRDGAERDSISAKTEREVTSRVLVRLADICQAVFCGPKRAAPCELDFPFKVRDQLPRFGMNDLSLLYN